MNRMAYYMGVTKGIAFFSNASAMSEKNAEKN